MTSVLRCRATLIAIVLGLVFGCGGECGRYAVYMDQYMALVNERLDGDIEVHSEQLIRVSAFEGGVLIESPRVTVVDRRVTPPWEQAELPSGAVVLWGQDDVLYAVSGFAMETFPELPKAPAEVIEAWRAQSESESVEDDDRGTGEPDGTDLEEKGR